LNWIAQAALQKILVYVPYGHECNYFIRRYVTKRLPQDRPGFMWTARNAAKHFAAFRQHNSTTDIADARCCEIGAGWEFTVPLLFYAFGIEHQLLIDLERHARLGLINHTIARIAADKAELEEKTSISLRDMDTTPIETFDDLEHRFGIEYRAPYDARDTGSMAESFDLLSNTATLEHIPEVDIKRILSEAMRLLKPGGTMSACIDMDDHASHVSSKVSCYNFLRFSDRQWSLLTTDGNYQNRLRYPDYMRLFRDAGFDVVAEEPTRADEAELRSLEAMTLVPEFMRGYSLEDLAVHTLDVVLTKPAA
jgi:SAM-dependent methyltransferase